MPAPELIIAAVMLAALVIYCLTGGADFGGGLWDLLARGPRAKAQRQLIKGAIAPVWEANHVWLVVVIVLLFVCFPTAFAAIMTALHIPLALMLVSIVLRGSAFVFRTFDAATLRERRGWRRVFAVSSGLAPLMLGVTLGAVASGDMHMDPETGRVQTDFISQWLAPFPFAIGLFTVAMFAFLAAVYLTLETRDRALREDFRRKALVAAVAVGAMALVSFLLSGSGAPHIRRGLTREWWSVPFHALTGVAAVAAMWALWRRRYKAARILAAAQVALIIVGWGLSQYPDLVTPDLTLSNAAAPDSVLVPVALVLAIGAVPLAPAFWYLYRVFGKAGAD
jgi:cytochrome d ubiquinol oxidase subunit II